MAESKLASLIKQYTASYNVSSVVSVFSMLSLGCILILDLVVINLFMYSLPGMIKTHGSESRGQEEAACTRIFWPTRQLQ